MHSPQLPTRRSSLPLFAFLFAICASVANVLAGPLTPPPGPITSTHKTLTEVEPRIPINSTNTPGDFNSLFKITQPGSYYLTGNITGQASFQGIEIASVNVTLDLNGFTLTGVPLSLQGIVTDGFRSNITIRNGSVNSWGSDGINLVQGGSSNNHRIESVRVASNGRYGINVGSQSIIQNCIAASNADSGFNTAYLCVFENCTSRSNGFRGFATQGGSLFDHCAAVQNTSDGFFIWSSCTLTSCIADGNGGNGIETNDEVTINGCTISDNGENGIVIDNNCSVFDTTVQNNDGIGILSLTGGTIARCTIFDNALHGISCGSRHHILENNCNTNGVDGSGAGIHITGADNRIEANTLTTNDWGMQVTAAGNFISRNIASGNTIFNWDIVANNKCHVILGANAIAITGDSGGVSQGSTNPNANYTY